MLALIGRIRPITKRVQVNDMANIIYFGTCGCVGHCPVGIDEMLTQEEYKYWCELDNDRWICAVANNPGYGKLTEHGKVVYTRYSQPWSVDDHRVGSHTNLLWKGDHTEEEIISLIKSNPFLTYQFRL